MNHAPQYILISRTDSIGDVVLTLPVAAVLKEYFPGSRIGFIGRSYTKPVINACKHIDVFIDREDFLGGNATIDGQQADTIIHVFPDYAIATQARKMGIRTRVGTTNRIFHWFTCNKLVKLSRKKSDLHEAQLNLRLLQPFGYTANLPLSTIGLMIGLTKLQPLPDRFESLLAGDKYNLILHPKSQGSAREWGLDNFISLIQQLDKNKTRIFISGTAKERTLLDPLFDQVGEMVIDITGQMSLDEFIAFIARADGLLANSTGPLHIAAALGKDALGIYPPMRPIHPGRWAPLGPKAKVFVLDKYCIDCKKQPGACYCIKEVSPLVLQQAIGVSIKNAKEVTI